MKEKNKSLKRTVSVFKAEYREIAPFCQRPRKVMNPSSPNGYYLTRCNSRQYSYCSYCSSLYQFDYQRIIESGFTKDGYKYYALTLTAPSFGKVHSDIGVCACGNKHSEDDDLLGTPIGKYDYTTHARWMINFKKLLLSTLNQINQSIEFEVITAREWQRRGVLHVHLLFRVSDKDNQDNILRVLKKAKTTKVNGFGWGRSFVVDEVDPEDIKGISVYFTKGLGRTAKQQSKEYGILPLAKRKHYNAINQKISIFGDKLSDNAKNNLGWSGHFITFSSGWSHEGLTLKSLREERYGWVKENFDEDSNEITEKLEEVYEKNKKRITPDEKNNLETGEINDIRLNNLLQGITRRGVEIKAKDKTEG